ncbi:MAG: hypothetical protein AB8F78_18495 [Saprospiraceae bacterium]
MRTFLKWIVGLLLFLVLVGLVTYLVLDETKPEGVQGPQAEALADKMLRATNLAAWDTTKVISWDFGGRHQFKWNKAQDSVDVMWGDVLVKLHTKSVTGAAFVNGKQLTGDEANQLVQSAWSYFCNDSFWLSAPYKIRDPGTSRSLVTLPNGDDALMVSYDSGGVTPGDSYLWILDEAGLPTAWKMWTQIIPIGGIEASWGNYKTLPSGAVLAQSHKIIVLPLELSGITEE